MADKDYNYCIVAQDLAPYQASKENLDVLRLVYDFSLYLETGEVISLIDRPTISFMPSVVAPIPNWRQDYPVGTIVPAGTAPQDTYPLVIQSEAIGNLGQSVDMWVFSGTPACTYVMSFIALGSVTQRRKQVDTLITIQQPVNPLMVGGPVAAAPGQILVIGGSTNLPAGFDGLLLFQNAGSVPGTIITFPPSPSLGQSIEFIDVLGTDTAAPVTFQGSGAPVDGDGSATFVSAFNYDCLRWRWTGSHWHLMATRFNFLA